MESGVVGMLMEGANEAREPEAEEGVALGGWPMREPQSFSGVGGAVWGESAEKSEGCVDGAEFWTFLQVAKPHNTGDVN